MLENAVVALCLAFGLGGWPVFAWAQVEGNARSLAEQAQEGGKPVERARTRVAKPGTLEPAWDSGWTDPWAGLSGSSADFDRLQDSIDRMVRDMVAGAFSAFPRTRESASEGLGDGTEAPARFFSPQADIQDVGDAYQLVLDLPGMQREEIEVSLEEGILAVRGERAAARESIGTEASETDETGERAGPSFVRRERSFGRFERRFSLPDDAEEESISARYENGILTIAVPKRAGSRPSARAIPIR